MPTAKKTAAARPVEDVHLPPDPETGINELQMRRLHGLYRSRLHMTDRGDILDHAATYLGRSISHKTELTRDEADRLITHLDTLEPIALPEQWAALTRRFDDEAIGKLPRSTCRACSRSERKVCENHTWIRCSDCNNSHSSATMHIDYVGHADITQRLNEVDPGWTWEPLGRDQFGNPAYDRDNNLWIKMTVLGETRIGVGDAENGKGAKERVGDAIRNGAMRFGVGLSLWAKGDREWANTDKDFPEPHPDTQPPPEPVADARAWPTKGDSLLRIDDLAGQIGKTRAEVTSRWRALHENLPVERLVDLPPDVLAGLADAVAARVEELVRAEA